MYCILLTLPVFNLFLLCLPLSRRTWIANQPVDLEYCSWGMMSYEKSALLLHLIWLLSQTRKEKGRMEKKKMLPYQNCGKVVTTYAHPLVSATQTAITIIVPHCAPSVHGSVCVEVRGLLLVE